MDRLIISNDIKVNNKMIFVLSDDQKNLRILDTSKNGRVILDRNIDEDILEELYELFKGSNTFSPSNVKFALLLRRLFVLGVLEK